MNKNKRSQAEKTLQELCAEEQKELTLPDSLKAEKIKEKILAFEENRIRQDATEASTGSDGIQGHQEMPQRTRRFPIRHAGTVLSIAAAALVLVIGGSTLARSVHLDSSDKTTSQLPVSVEKGQTEADGTAMGDSLTDQAVSDAKTLPDGICQVSDYEELLKLCEENGVIYAEHYAVQEKQSIWSKIKVLFSGEASDEKYEYATGVEESIAETESVVNTDTTADAGMNAGADMSAESGTDDAADFLDTNVQTQGVDEADIIKTDGTYIYRLSSSRQEIVIYRAEQEKVTMVGSIALEAASGNTYQNYRDILLYDGYLAVLATSETRRDGTYYGGNELETVEIAYDGAYYGGDYLSQTELWVYDISNPASPRLLDTRRQEGSYRQARMVGSMIYLMSTKYNNSYFYCDTGEELERFTENCIPQVDGESLSCSNIFLPERPMSSNFVIITSTDICHPEQHVDTVAIMGNADQIYVSTDSIYLWQTDWNWSSYEPVEPMPAIDDEPVPEENAVEEITEEYIEEEDVVKEDIAEVDVAWSTAVRGHSEGPVTTIMRYAYEDGILRPIATGQVKGYLNNSFSMDEYNGYLRVVTTRDYEKEIVKEEGQVDYEYTTENQLYILDHNMQVVGSIEDLAEGEYVKSARFFGDIGYFVTFRQTDPLFSVDLSNPEQPRILGALKIPGFSEYLHPYGDGLLLGLGQEADETSGGTQGVKLSMFDISDPSQVKEVAKLVVRPDAQYSYTEAEYNHRAILVSGAKNLIGFALESSGNKNNRNSMEWEQQYEYCLYSYEEGVGFVERILHDFEDWEFCYSSRGIYIGDYLYIVYGDRQVAVYRLSDGASCGKYDFR